MDLKKLLTVKNVAVGSIITIAAILSSIQIIRDNILKLFPHAPQAVAIKWDTIEDDRVTGRLTFDFYWPGTRDADAPTVKSSRIEGARRLSGDSSLIDVGQRIGRDKWPVSLHREKSGKFWQPVSVTILTDRAGTTQIFIPQEEATPAEIAQKPVPQRPAKPPVTAAPAPKTVPRDTLINSVQSTVEEAAMKELRRILSLDDPAKRVVGLEQFIRNPQYAGTAAWKQAQQELKGVFGK